MYRWLLLSNAFYLIGRRFLQIARADRPTYVDGVAISMSKWQTLYHIVVAVLLCLYMSWRGWDAPSPDPILSLLWLVMYAGLFGFHGRIRSLSRVQTLFFLGPVMVLLILPLKHQVHLSIVFLLLSGILSLSLEL